MVNCFHLVTPLPVMFVVIVVSFVSNCLLLINCEEMFDSSPGGGNDFRDNIHNGKFVIYDQIDRQMVESSMDEVMASGDDESFPFMTKVLPDYQHKDTQTLHTYMLPPSEAEGHFNHHFDAPLQLDVNDKFGYHVSGNHQIQAERQFKQPGQRNLPFKIAESIQSPVFATSSQLTATTTKTPLFKARTKERPSLAPTSFIRHPDKIINQQQQSGLSSFDHYKPLDKTKVSPVPAPTSFLSTINITPAPTLSYPPSVSTSSSISSSSSIRAVHVPREDDKKQLAKTQKPKKYFPEPVKITISPRFESLRIKSPEAQANAAKFPQTATSTVPQPQPISSIYSPRPISTTPMPPSPAVSTPWRTNSRFPSWGNNHNINANNNNNYHHYHHHQHQQQLQQHQQHQKHQNHKKHFDDGEDYIPGDKISAQSTPFRYHVESPRNFKPSSSSNGNFLTDHFKDLEDFEGTSASDEIGSSVVNPIDLNNHPLNTPTSTRIAVQNHPDLTDKQRDSLLKILESYYKLINQFNLDFRKLINESRGAGGKGNKLKSNNTIVIEPKITVEQ